MSQKQEPKQIEITSPDGREARIAELRRLFPDLFDGEGVLDEKDSSRFYFTVETKGASEFEKLKEDEKLKIRCAVRHFEAIGLKGYLAPVEDLPSFDTKARERVGETFFNR